MKNAVISVIIPLYNKALHIERTVMSVLQQTVQDFEIIVVDDGSTDGGSEIVGRLPDTRVRLIRQENAGVSAARNRGITESRAELVAFLDADDEWKPQFLETILGLQKMFPEAGAYATAYEIYKPNGTIMRPSYKGIPASPWAGIIPNYFQAGLGPQPVCSSAVAIPKHVFKDVGEFPVGVVAGEDADTWLRIALRYPVAFSHTCQAIYHKEATNRAAVRHICHAEVSIAKTANLAIQQGIVPVHLQDDLREYVAKYQILIGIQCVKAGDLTKARRLLAACKDTKKFRYRRLMWYAWAMMPQVVTQIVRGTKRTFVKAINSYRRGGQLGDTQTDA